LVEHAQGPTARYLLTIDLTPEQARRRILEMLRVANAALNDQRTAPPQAAPTKRKTPALDAFTSDLVRRARKGKLPKLVRRLADADRVKAGLLRLARRNVLIVGDQGSGKTSLVQTLAKEIALEVVPDALRGRRIRQIDPVLLVAGTKYRGQYEERVAAILDETIQTDTILFLDDLQLLALPRRFGSAPQCDREQRGSDAIAATRVRSR
jgi:ATP-dependent Clp protease ATP-binding subunit ClpA